MRIKLYRTLPALLIAVVCCQVIPVCCAQSEPAELYNKSFALVIGISQYKEAAIWPPLPNAVGDAKSMDELLSKMGFQVTSLYDGNATREAIYEAFDDLAKKVGPEDALLFYFAGHGQTERMGGSEVAFLLPSDAVRKSSSYIPFNELEEFSRKADHAKHQLFILDCAAGGVLGRGETTGGSERKDVEIRRNTPEWLNELTRPKARELIVSGMAYEKVLDGGDGTAGHSFFTALLLQGLNGAADQFHDGYITFAELTDFLRRKYANPTQHLYTAVLPGHIAGRDFVFTNPIERRRIQVLHRFEPGELSDMQNLVLRTVAAKWFWMDLLSAMEEDHIVNLEFETGDAAQPVRDSGDSERAHPHFDYILELKYSPLDRVRLRVEARFKKTRDALPDFPPLEAVLSVEKLSYRPLVQQILRRMTSDDLRHMHLAVFDCQCDPELENEARAAVRSWLSDTHIPGIRFVEDSDHEPRKDIDILVELRALSQENRTAFTAAIIVTTSKEGAKPFMKKVDIASWKTALQEVLKEAGAYISDLAKQH
jgi:hypothetical protein